MKDQAVVTKEAYHELMGKYTRLRRALKQIKQLEEVDSYDQLEPCIEIARNALEGDK